MKLRKVFSLFAAAALCLSLAACGSGDAAGSKAPSGTSNPGSSQGGGDNAELTTNDVWPSGTTVYVDVPAKAGGGTDLYTRYLTAALADVCPGVNFVVTNYETSEVGMEHCKTAAADGLTLVTAHGGGIIQYLTSASNVSLKDDLKVVGIMNQGGPQAIIARPDSPYKNFNELADYAKSNPGEVIIGCSLGGTTQMIFTSLMDALTGDSSTATYVQCASEADKLTQTASGSIDVANCSIPNALAYEADGKLTILGTIGPKVSTLDTMGELLGQELTDAYKSGPEQGIDSATWDSNYYVLAPAGTPDNVCKAINEALMKAVEVDSYVEGNKAMATFIAALDYEASQKALNDEWDFLDALVDGMGLKTR